MAPVLGPAQRRELLGSMLRELAQQQDEELQACAARLLVRLARLEALAIERACLRVCVRARARV